MKRVWILTRQLWPASSTAQVNRLWAGGVLGVGAGASLELGAGVGLAIAGVLLLFTAWVYAKGEGE